MDKFRSWFLKDEHKLSYLSIIVFAVMLIIISLILTNWYKSYKYLKNNNQQLVVEVLEQNRKLIDMRLIVFQLIHETELCLVTDHVRNCEDVESGERKLDSLIDELFGLNLIDHEKILLYELKERYHTYYKTVYNDIESSLTMSTDEQIALNLLGHQLIEIINQLLEYNYMHAQEISESSLEHSKSTTLLFYLTIFLLTIIIIIIVKFVLKPSYKMEKIMLKEANLDYLTKLLNRNGFKKAMSSKIIENSEFKGSILMLDLDGFKNINDSLGHDAGDQMLKEISKLIIACLRKQDVIMRLGGDEFVMFIDQVDDKVEIGKLCERLLNSIANLKCFENFDLFVTASIGGCVLSKECTDIEMNIKKADIALYRAKENGKNQYIII